MPSRATATPSIQARKKLRHWEELWSSCWRKRDVLEAVAFEVPNSQHGTARTFRGAISKQYCPFLATRDHPMMSPILTPPFETRNASMKPISTILSILMILSSSLHAAPLPDVAHSVSIDDLRIEISARNVERASNIREVQTLLRHPEVQKFAHLFDLEKIEAVIPRLDDATLSRLADESARMNERFQAGHPHSWNRTAVITVVATMAMIVLVVLITTR